MAKVALHAKRLAKMWLYWSALIGTSYAAAWLLRFEFSIAKADLPVFWLGLAITLMVKGLAYCTVCRHLHRWSRYATFSDLVDIARANAIGAAGVCVMCSIVVRGFPRSVYLLDPMICFFACGCAHFVVRLLNEIEAGRKSNSSAKGLLIYGAGVAGLALARETRGNASLGYRLVGFIDDDPRKLGATLLGLPVLGSGDSIPQVIKRFQSHGTRVDELVVAMPSATGKQLRAAMEKGNGAGVPSRIVPALGELISGKLAVGNLREVSVTDLLGREPVTLDIDPIRRSMRGRTILVTGAAGSIGTELCHQLAEMGPRELVALDQGESDLFRLEGELRSRYPGLNLTAEIGDIRDGRRLEKVIEEHGIEAIYHAAAYKHVPVMERQVCEAVRNNVIGTWNLAQAAWRMNVPRCLLISSDKAVNPSSIMGLTKRICELIFSAKRPELGRGSATKFMCVRFGNVLVSNGSVVPIFRKQIAAGGPVTVTHPDMRRYFMTVQEAVQLVLQASTMANGSEIYVLDMGRPVPIVQLARKMIALAGLVPDEDIEIRFVGLRPGEKLYEDLSLDAENLLATNHPKIRIFQGHQMAFDQLVPWITELQNHLWRGDEEAVVEHMAALVPEYRPMSGEVAVFPDHSGVRTQPAAAVAVY
jgi:FlaA1/EpsC-like NDP-sugar epimerase